MTGAIIGDMAGSVFEFHPWKGDWRDIPLLAPKAAFTDDTVLTFAVAEALMDSDGKAAAFGREVVPKLDRWGNLYPGAGFGGMFARWLAAERKEPYNSFGNGSAMRVSPVGWAFDTLEEVEKFAAISAEPTHNHPEGIKGAQAVAGAILLARQGKSKNDIRDYLTGHYGYALTDSVEKIKATYGFDETCPGSVPEAFAAFLESGSFEETIKKAIWLGGDADTQAAIAGSVAEAFFGKLPDDLVNAAYAKLDERCLAVLSRWNKWIMEREN